MAYVILQLELTWPITIAIIDTIHRPGSRSASHENLRLLWDPRFHYRKSRVGYGGGFLSCAAVYMCNVALFLQGLDKAAFPKEGAPRKFA
jgi:hypothetical protein